MLRRRSTPLAAAVVLVATALAAGGNGSAAASTSGPLAAADARVTVRSAPEEHADTLVRARDRVAGMDLRERAASVVMGHIPTTDPAAVASYVRDNALGGFILMGANIPPGEGALRALTSTVAADGAFPPLLAIDQEGGDVSRLSWDGFAGARTLQTAEPDATRAAFAARAALVDRAGASVNFGIVADVPADGSSFISRRALGATPDAAAARVQAAVEGERGVVASTLKHFPGHGAAPGDSHAGIPQTDLGLDAWRAADAVPFRAGIEAGAELLMFGHLRYSAVDERPASLSSEWHRIARDELGFDGVAVTDDLGMLQASGEADLADPVANAVAAVAAGSDLVLAVMFSTADTAPRIVDGLVAAVESGALPAERLDEAAARVAALRLAHADAGTGFVPCGTCAPAG